MAAVAQSASILKKGVAELDPLVATVHTDACTGCGDCLTTCPYDAIASVELEGRTVAEVAAAVCKGCGGCVPLCPVGALDLLGYTDVQMTAMIDSLVEVPVS
jgi:heterodisulfide reductase subunit A